LVATQSIRNRQKSIGMGRALEPNVTPVGWGALH